MLLLAGLQLSSRLQLAQKGLPADRGLLSSAAPESERSNVSVLSALPEETGAWAAADSRAGRTTGALV